MNVNNGEQVVGLELGRVVFRLLGRLAARSLCLVTRLDICIRLIAATAVSTQYVPQFLTAGLPDAALRVASLTPSLTSPLEFEIKPNPH